MVVSRYGDIVVAASRPGAPGGCPGQTAFYPPGIVPFLFSRLCVHTANPSAAVDGGAILTFTCPSRASSSATLLHGFPFNKQKQLSWSFRFASYGAFYAVTVQLLSRKDALKKTIAIIIIFASSLSFFSILQHLLSNGKLYWFRELLLGGVPFGPYVNRNHYAGLMEMLFPLVVGFSRL
jgi:hypothetical protein